MKDPRISLDTVLFQKDRRIRLPKTIIKQLDAIPGEASFEIFYDIDTEEIILRKIKEDPKNEFSKGGE
jgi:hypothetical protein